MNSDDNISFVDDSRDFGVLKQGRSAVWLYLLVKFDLQEVAWKKICWKYILGKVKWT